MPERANPLDAARRWKAHRLEHGSGEHAVAIAASFTAQPIEAGLGTALLDAGLMPSITFCEANQLFQICLAPADHGVNAVDDVVVLWRIEDLFESDLHAWSTGDDGAVGRIGVDAVSLARAVIALAGNTGARVTFSDAPIPVGFGFDHRDPDELAALTRLCHDVNQAVDDVLIGHDTIDRVRLSAVQGLHGTAATFDRRSWLMYRQPFTALMSHAVGCAAADVIAARRRVPPKVLVLDCDGTLWDGVAADDGIGGLDASDAFPGRAFQEFQRAAQRLRHRGVLLALCSKNDPETVEAAFEAIDGMVLTSDDIATRRVSWDPKPAAIADLVAELNLGLDAAVFVDDSPYEVGSVSEQLPTVRCLQVPVDVEELPDLLAESGLFRSMRINDDDRERTGRIQAEAQRAALAPEMSHEDFLASLGLTVELFDVTADDQARVTQLINKTNQFNLTTRRRDLGDVALLMTDADWRVLAIRVADRFGEYGIVGAIIGERIDATWRLDTVLMSCRVLGRGVETAMLALAAQRLRADTDLDIIGTYVATDRNERVRSLFADHGFVALDDHAPGDSSVLRVGQSIEVPAHVTATTVRNPAT
ncbi:MAG: FkbH-like protein [Candidatus Azotimanducaceae bacterium]